MSPHHGHMDTIASTMTPHDDLARMPATALAASFTYAEACRAGLSDRRLASLVSSGAVPRIGRGVYRRADAPLVDDDLHELFQKNPKNYDIAYDEDGEWSYYRGEWLLSCPAGYNPLDYPLIDDYDDPLDY